MLLCHWYELIVMGKAHLGTVYYHHIYNKMELEKMQNREFNI